MDLNFSFQMSTPPLTKTLEDVTKLYDVIVIGAGPAGLNAALYAKRKGLEVLVLSQKRGGQILDTSSVDNYLGLQNVSGEALAQHFIHHIESLKIPTQDHSQVIDYYEIDGIHHVKTDSEEIFKSKTVIIASGSKPRKLNIPGEERFLGKGVAYCAICDAPLFSGKDVFIAGGGNSAVEAALDVAKFANSVTLLHRSQLRADQILIDQLYQHPKIIIRLDTKIVEITGTDTTNGVLVETKDSSQLLHLKGDGLFIEIGHIPNTGPFGKYVELNQQGEIMTSSTKATNIPGIFAAGDVTDVPYKQIIIAVADGATAALSANNYLNHTH